MMYDSNTQWGMAHLFWLICSSPIVRFCTYIYIQYIHTSGMSSFLTKKEKANKSWECEHLVSNWLPWASVRAHTDMGQSDTRVVGLRTVCWLSDEVDCPFPQLVILSSQQCLGGKTGPTVWINNLHVWITGIRINITSRLLQRRLVWNED